jgi:general secretion pathway protein G
MSLTLAPALGSPAALPGRPVRRRSRSGGFTILEILVVLAILGLLIGVLLNGLTKSYSKAQTQVARLFVQQTMRTALTRYSLDLGTYPTTDEGLQSLISAPADKADRWQGPYLEGGKIPLDPWGREYKYLSPGAHNKDSYDIWSLGPSGQDGGTDNIGNW